MAVTNEVGANGTHAGGQRPPGGAPDDVRILPPDRLAAMAAAAQDLAACRRLLAKTSHNVVGEVLRGEAEFMEWNHFPDGDAYDPESHAQFYYHAHPPEERTWDEHGHFHLFLRPKGMPPGVRPAAGQDLPAGENDALSHLVAIAMDSYGEPVRLFTTNRWVTGDVWYPATDVVRMLDNFAIDIVRPNLVVARWITAMVRLFQPQICDLLRQRDLAVEGWRRSHPGVDVFEDRGLEVTSWLDISIDDQIARVAATGDGHER